MTLRSHDDFGHAQYEDKKKTLMSNDPYNRIPDTRLPRGTLKPSKVSFEGFEGRRVGVIYSLMAIGSMLRPRWLPEKSFPPYAYLPGCHLLLPHTSLTSLHKVFQYMGTS
jgi:hypothetical protein